jgi:hypothetical protein
MLDLIECGRNKLEDSILMTWALRRYEHAQAQCGDLSRSMEEAWFDDLTLRRWIDANDREILTELFRVLPVRRFSNLKPAIVKRWEAWSGPLAYHARTVLLESQLEEVLPLFARHIEGNLLDADKTLAVIESVTRLPESIGRELIDDATGRISELKDGSVTRQMLLQALLRPTAVLDPGRLLRLTDLCARAVRGGQDDVERLSKATCFALLGNAVLLDYARYLIESADAQPFRLLQPLFTDGAPLEECDRILAKTDPWPGAKELLEKHGSVSAATEMALPIIKIIQSIDGAKDDDMACFAVAAVLSAFERDEIDADRFSMEEALTVLTLDLPDNRHLRGLKHRLGAFAPRDVARAVSERMPTVRNAWGGVHLARLAGELRLVDAIPILIDSLVGERGDFLCEAAQKSLVRIGEPAQLALIAQWDEFDASQKIYGRGVLEQVGGQHAREFAIERFRELFHDDIGSWCELAEAAPDERLIELLEPEVRRKQTEIDESFYCLCVLTGREHVKLMDIRKRVIEHRQRILKRQSDFAAGNFRQSNTVTLALKCERCRDVNRYEVKDIVAGRSKTEPAFFVCDEFPCASCGEWPDFEFTTETYIAMTAAMITLAAGKEAAKNKSKGPLRLVDVNYRWERRPAPEVLAELKTAVAEDPENIVNQLRLGRFQHVFDRRRHAAECYSRALEIEPDSMEAGLGMAHVMAGNGDQKGAYNRLCAMLERKGKWRFFRVDELGPKNLVEEFAWLYNELQSALRLRGRPLLHTSFLQSNAKVGRNVPCPCGSGKKYKKCCGGRMSAMQH